MRKRNNITAQYQNGFTLMEVMVSLFILSILSITAVSGLNAVLRSQSKQVGVSLKLQSMQFTYSWLEQDLNQYVARDVLNAHGERLPALMLNTDSERTKIGVQGDILLVLTRGGITDPSNLTSLQRVAYALNDRQIIRYTWPVLDATTATLVRSQVLLHNVINIQLRYLSDKGNYYHNWNDYSGKATLPLAVEWQITTEDGQTLTWLFPITGSIINDEEQDITQ